MRVATINLWGRNEPWELRRRELAEWLAELRADVVCMQEVGGGGGAANQATALVRTAPASGLGYNVAYAWSPTPEGPAGVAVASREPFEEVRRFALPGDPDRDPIARSLLLTRTYGVDVYTTHLSPHAHLSDLRGVQVAAIDAVVAERGPAAPGVFAGDLNADADAPEIAPMRERWVDCWDAAGSGDGATWAPGNPFQPESTTARRLDYVFLLPPAGADLVAAARLAFDEARTGTFASDHYGVVVDLRSGTSDGADGLRAN